MRITYLKDMRNPFSEVYTMVIIRIGPMNGLVLARMTNFCLLMKEGAVVASCFPQKRGRHDVGRALTLIGIDGRFYHLSGVLRS